MSAGPPAPPPSQTPGGSSEQLAKALQDYKKGYYGYFEDKTDGWIMGVVTADASISEASLIPMRSPLQTREIKVPVSALETLPPLKNPDNMDYVDDLSQLSYLHEPAVFSAIKNRFLHKMDPKIYTYSGMALIAMNPFAKVDIYSEDIMKEYAGVSREAMQPHIYGIAEECYRAMLTGKDQSVIVSGESGAGKTQSTKYIMQYLAVVDSLSKARSEAKILKSETEDAVLASNPILESFGNAKTTRNDNSSRFGKFVELFFSDRDSHSVRITGAKIRTYLLERSRLIFQPESERNYHIFYQLCAAAPAAEKKRLSLDRWESFHYLNQGRAGVVKTINDIHDFKDTQDALSTVGIPVESQWDIFKICAALLHLGNVKVKPAEKDGSLDKSESSIANDDSALDTFTTLLGIKKADFVQCVTKKQTTIRNDTMVTSLSVDLANVTRDSVTKAIYTKLFDWLVRIINRDLKRESVHGQNFIGVLDIYGFVVVNASLNDLNTHNEKRRFEHFAVNSFEQFCINYANEKLQQEFTKHVFRLEQEEYIREGLENWTMIQFSDNQPCIDLIEGKVGILSILDDKSKVQNTKDEEFIDSMNKTLANPTQKYYIKAKFGNDTFTVKHYAVNVTYTAAGFIDKNKDSVSDEMKDVLRASTNSFFKEIFSPDQSATEEPAYASSDKTRMRRSTLKSKSTLGSMFKSSLEELMETIRATEGHYIRCIKPNMAKTAFGFEGPAVLAQLKACGVLETIKISNEGFPSKLTYEEFAEGYYTLINSDFWESKDKRDVCKRIISPLIDSSKYRFGKTKIFFKSGQIAFFDARRRERVIFLMNYGQKNIRRFLQRTKYKETLVAISDMQMHAQRYIAEKKLAKLRHEAALRKAEEERKRLLAEQEAARKHESIVLLQSCVRRRNAFSVRQKLKQEAKNAEKNAERFKEKASSLENKVVSLAAESAAKQTEIQDLATRNVALSKDLDTAKSALAAAQERIQMLESELESVKRDTHDLHASSGYLNGRMSVSTESGVSMAKSPSRAGRHGLSRAPSLKRSNSIVSKEHQSELKALRAENDALKMMLDGNRVSTVTAGSSGMKRAPTMTRGKSIYSGDIMELAERERQKNGNSASSTQEMIQQRTTSIPENAKALSHRIEVLGREMFINDICDALITKVQIPMRIGNDPLYKRDVHFPSHILGCLFGVEMDLGMVIELYDFCEGVVEAFQEKAKVDGNNRAIMCFLISNACELLGIVSGLQESESKKPNNRANMNILSKIRASVYGLLDIDLLSVFLANAIKEVIPLSAPALLETQDLAEFYIAAAPKTTWFGAAEEFANDGLAKLNMFLVDVGVTLRTYMVDNSLYQFIMMEILRTVGMTSFNDLLQRKNFLCPNRAIQIENNVNTVISWYTAVGLDAAPSLIILKEASKIAMLQKTSASDIQAVYSVVNQLNANQVQQLLTVCYNPSPAPDNVDIPISLEFREVVRSHATASKATDILAIGLTKQDQPLTVGNVHTLDKYVPPSVILPEEYVQLLQ
ncbi:Myosin type-2 heavy chain 1 [Chytriomyces hyalinus]|nr:Myosin type-2 heavy chain 1 [Chytriomyces hyalinus]